MDGSSAALGLTPMIARLACAERVSNSTRASARAAGSVLASTGRVRSPRLKPTSAYSGESHSVHEADGLETLLHTRRHLRRPAVEPGDSHSISNLDKIGPSMRHSSLDRVGEIGPRAGNCRSPCPRLTLREKKCRAGQHCRVEECRSAKQCQSSSAGRGLTPTIAPLARA